MEQMADESLSNSEAAQVVWNVERTRLEREELESKVEMAVSIGGFTSLNLVFLP